MSGSINLFSGASFMFSNHRNDTIGYGNITCHRFNPVPSMIVPPRISYNNVMVHAADLSRVSFVRIVPDRASGQSRG